MPDHWKMTAPSPSATQAMVDSSQLVSSTLRGVVALKRSLRQETGR